MVRRFLLILLGGGILFNGCSPYNPMEKAPSPPMVRVIRVAKEAFQPALKTFGTLTYTRKADVYSSQEGTIDTVQVEEGDRVTSGQVIATISKEKLLIAREQASATVSCRKALLALAEEKLREGQRAVEARILAMEKAEAEVAQKGIEYSHLSEVFETKKKLFHAGGIPGGDLEVIRTQYLKGKTEWEQAARDLEIQRIGFRDADLLEAGYPLARSKAERMMHLKELGTKTLQAERDVALGELSIARAELHRIDLLLAETEIRSPLSGIVSLRAIEMGEKVSPETLLFSIYDPESLYALVEVHERDLPSLRIGQVAEVQLGSSQPLSTLSGRVRILTPYLNPQSHSAQARILLDPPYNQGNLLHLFPGMFVRLTIPTGPGRMVIQIPESALLLEDTPGENQDGAGKTTTSPTVFILRDSTLFKVPVRLGDRIEGRVEVQEGLQEGDRVVVNPTRALGNGMRVEVLE